MHGHERMISGSRREGFKLITSDVDWMSWNPKHKVICDLSQVSLYRIPQHTVILMEGDDLPPGFTRLNLMSPSNDENIRSSCVIQRRVEGSTDFNKTWNEYKDGFGSVNSSYWLGIDVIHLLTKQKPSLYVSITLTNKTTLYQQYGEFSISNEADNYRLYLNGPTTGILGDSIMLTTGMSDTNLFGMTFSTLDRDNVEHRNV
ncbi:microfibril-associated glycoprotein 4-like [Saccostrea cucullata]|uniref:microfibril-associated glycoprotein 4-like n=1 Tax=Saccostrea cuccullata TaxID=36930 RepID=UPI002ED02207